MKQQWPQQMMNIISYGTLTNHVHNTHFQLTHKHFQKKGHIIQPSAMKEEIFIFLLLLLLVPMGLFSVWGKNFHNVYFRYSSISGVHEMCFELSPDPELMGSSVSSLATI